MHKATVVRNDPAGTQLRALSFDAVLDGYRRPGQFVAVQGFERPAHFALASSPGEPVLLLVKQEGEAAIALGALAPGDKVELSDPIGVGFPLERIAGLPMVVMANGSGISAARPVVRAEVAAGVPRPVHLYYGVLTPDRRSFLDDLDTWVAAGVHVETVVQESVPGWAGPTGFVQDVAGAQGLVRADVGVVLVGVPPMLAAVRALYRDAGVPDEHILVNF